jgi:hypothetical protein
LEPGAKSVNSAKAADASAKVNAKSINFFISCLLLFSLGFLDYYARLGLPFR